MSLPAAVEVVADDGIRLHADVDGIGPHLVILHGLGYAGWAAGPLRELLRNRCTVWSLDTRGSGRSDKPLGPYSVQRFADDAGALLDLIDEPVHLLGYSMGGYVAQTVAHDRPESIRSLTLVSTSAGGLGAEDVPSETRAHWERHAHLPPAEFARTTMPLSFSDGWPQRHPEDFERILALRLAAPTPGHAWRAQYDASARFLASGYDVSRLDMPTLVIHGSDDRVVPVANGRDLAARLPRARYHEITGGHLLHLEDPRFIADLIADLLASPHQTIAHHTERNDHAHH